MCLSIKLPFGNSLTIIVPIYLNNFILFANNYKQATNSLEKLFSHTKIMIYGVKTDKRVGVSDIFFQSTVGNILIVNILYFLARQMSIVW